jgi:hypothetical protein
MVSLDPDRSRESLYSSCCRWFFHTQGFLTVKQEELTPEIVTFD